MHRQLRLRDDELARNRVQSSPARELRHDPYRWEIDGSNAKTLLGCPSGSVQGTALLLELDELLELLGELLLLELDDGLLLLELDDRLLALDSDELEVLLRDELLDNDEPLDSDELLPGGDDALLPLLSELPLLTALDDDEPLDPCDDDEPLDPCDDDELLDGGVYELLDPRLDELDDVVLLLGGWTFGGVGAHGGAHGGAQFGGYGG